MEQSESHPIRNGVIATVLGGILLSFWPAARAWFTSLRADFWSALMAVRDLTLTRVEIPLWAVSVLALLSAVLIGQLVLSTWRASQRRRHETDYTEDILFDVRWCWRWYRDEVLDLQPLCPNCGMELVYNETVQSRFDLYRGESDSTAWICQRCGEDRVRFDGRHQQGISMVKREIQRKVRTGEWAPNTPLQTAGGFVAAAERQPR